MSSKKITIIILFYILIILPISAQKSWTADNGNGTYTNPLFYDEFSDPDIIRVGNDFYLAGTTMHSMPGLVILHSKDLVNWTFLSYACDTLNMGDDFKLKNDHEAYGQGIWAPCIRYHNGMFYIFSNVNNYGLQVFMAKNPAGPWIHKDMGGHIYDLSVLFDDDGKVYAIHNYDEVKMIEIKSDFSGYVEGSDHVIIPHGNCMGEGHHFYKINGKYYIISANYSPTGRMQCARANNINGPYETATISVKESLGTERGHSILNLGVGSKIPDNGFKYNVIKFPENNFGAVALHQGGIVDLPNGDWWGFSMIDFKAVGRTTCLSPVTWKDGWPYFGLDGNLGRSPRTWYKPKTEVSEKPHAPYQRCDNFNGTKLLPVWQWNHDPVEGKWSLTEKKGVLRLHTLPAKQFLWAKNTLTQRCVGPVSSATVMLDARKLESGDIAGLGLLNIPYATLGIMCSGKRYLLCEYDQMTNKVIDKSIKNSILYLCVTGDYDNEIAQFSYSYDGKDFENIGDSVLIPYQMKTFQGPRYSLFAYNKNGRNGGYADFDNFIVDEPMADRSQNLPIGKIITLTNLADHNRVWANPHGMMHFKTPNDPQFNDSRCKFRVLDRGNGRVVLESVSGAGFITVVGAGLSTDIHLIKNETEGSLFMWQDMLRHQCMLLSLKTNRYVGLNPTTGESYSADWPGTTPDRKNGTVFEWKETE